MKKVYPITRDRFIDTFYTYEEAIDLFGEPDDYELKNEYIDIPNDLHERYINAYNEFLKIEKEFSEYINTKKNKREN